MCDNILVLKKREKNERDFKKHVIKRNNFFFALLFHEQLQLRDTQYT